MHRYSRTLDCITERNWESQYIKAFLRDLHSGQKDDSKSRVLIELKMIIDLLDYRLNMIVSIILNIGLLWDIRVIRKLARWRNKNIGKTTAIFIAIGKFEALISLANWAFNHPNYIYPTVDDDHFHLSAQDVQHPLIPSAQSVANNLEVKSRDHVAIITGSNMSGKSTFLRTIGINMVLGNTGTKVASSHMSYSLASLITYMRIKDALEENVSTFRAELNRVKLILDKLKRKEKCFFLVDEMLRGTNSKDKLKGSIAITKKIIEEAGYSLIATHDITLAELSSKFPNDIKNYYFDIDYADGELQFDYKLKTGICENFNASFLLAQLGIGEG